MCRFGFSLDFHCVFSEKSDVQYWIHSLFGNMYSPRALLWLIVYKCPEIRGMNSLLSLYRSLVAPENR